MSRSIHRHKRAIVALAVLSMFAAWSAASTSAQDAKAPDYDAIIAAPDRSDADRQTDQRRQPAKMLAFTGARPGIKGLDMAVNAGCSTSRQMGAVGPDGVVCAQDPAALIERFVKDKFDVRSQKPAMK